MKSGSPMEGVDARHTQALCFAAVAEDGSFTLAAQRLGCSKGHVSKQVGALERALGVQLLLRTTRRLVLTEAGRVYLEYCRQAREALLEGERAVSAAQQQVAGRLRVTVPTSMGEPLVMDLLLDLPKDVSHGWGYLSKNSSTSETFLVDAVLAAARGQTVLDPALLAGMHPRRGSDVARLTDRQFEVLRLLAQGLSNIGIGERLSITEKSVQNHVNAIYAALGIDADREHNPRVCATLKLLEETGPA